MPDGARPFHRHEESGGPKGSSFPSPGIFRITRQKEPGHFFVQSPRSLNRATDSTSSAAGALRDAGAADLADDDRHAPGRADDLRHRRTRFVRERGAAIDPLDAVRNQRLDFARGRGAALREAAHCGGDYREAAPLCARARRLDRRVEREDVGLCGKKAAALRQDAKKPVHIACTGSLGTTTRAPPQQPCPAAPAISPP